MSTVTLPGGETIWYKTTGSGAPLVQIHGSAFGHRNFEKMTPFAAKDFEVVDFDLPGFGESRGDPRPGGMEGIADAGANDRVEQRPTKGTPAWAKVAKYL